MELIAENRLSFQMVELTYRHLFPIRYKVDQAEPNFWSSGITNQSDAFLGFGNADFLEHGNKQTVLVL